MSWELAQLNIATMLAPLDSPILADFVAALDRINALADESPGFVWRLKSDTDDAVIAEELFGAEVIVNMSVWRSVDELHSYIYGGGHAQIMSRRKEWFSRMKDTYTVLWWVPEGHRPSPAEAKLKLELLGSKGASEEAFTFKNRFPMPA